MSLMELRLFGAKPAEDAEAQSTTPRLTLARRLAEAISAYAEAAAMARSTPFELHLPAVPAASGRTADTANETDIRRKGPTHDHPSPAIRRLAPGGSARSLRLARKVPIVALANWLAGRAKKAQARRLAELVSRMDPHLRDDIELPRDLEIPRGSNSTIAIATLIEVMSERRR